MLAHNQFTIEAISEIVSNEKGRGISILIGAGVSMSADIPSAMGMVSEITKRFPKTTEGLAGSSYADYMAALSTVDRKRLINDLVDKAKLNPAHYFLGLLMAKGYIKRIISTNFDPLAVKACYLHNSYPAVYDLTQVAKYKRGQFTEPSIIYLHGQSTGFKLVNTAEELRENRKRVSAFFDDILDDSHLLVIGYSGQNDGVLGALTAKKNRQHRIIWCSYGSSLSAKGLGKGVLPLINGSPDNKVALNVDADRFFSLLAYDLKVFPGLFLDNPITYVKEGYFRNLNLASFRRLRGTGIKTFSSLEHMSSYESRYKQQVPDLRERYRSMSDRERGLWRCIISGPTTSDLELINSDEPKNDSEREIFSWIAQNHASEVGQSISMEPDLFTESQLDEINRLFAYAIEVHPPGYQAYHNWGSCLALVSKSLQWRRNIFEDAHDKIVQSNELRSDRYVTLNALGYHCGIFAASCGDTIWKRRAFDYLKEALRENEHNLETYLSFAEVHSQFEEFSEVKHFLDSAAKRNIGLSRHNLMNNSDLSKFIDSESDWFKKFIGKL